MEVVRAEIEKRVDRDDGIEKPVGEGQRSRVGADRKYAVVDTGIARGSTTGRASCCSTRRRRSTSGSRA